MSTSCADSNFLFKRVDIVSEFVKGVLFFRECLEKLKSIICHCAGAADWCTFKPFGILSYPAWRKRK